MSKLKKYKPHNPGLRKTSVIDYNSILTGHKPYKKLIKSGKNFAGRNSSGKITVRHRGGGKRKLIRQVDFKRNFEKGFKVISIEYDPNRTAFVSLVIDLASGDKKYVLFNENFQPGKVFKPSKDFIEGNSYLLHQLPVGSLVSEIEIRPKQGAKMVRSAGSYAQVTAQEGKYTTLKMPSSEIRKVLSQCACVLGKIGNSAHELVRWGKAGRIRNKGIKPTVRGKVMNPVDHPHGGGEARNPIGMSHPKTPWGKHALGVRTRKKKKDTNQLILKRRNK